MVFETNAMFKILFYDGMRIIILKTAERLLVLNAILLWIMEESMKLILRGCAN